MDHYAGGIDVSLATSSVCVLDATGRIVREAKVAPCGAGAGGAVGEGRRQGGGHAGGLLIFPAPDVGAGRKWHLARVRWLPGRRRAVSLVPLGMSGAVQL